MLRPAPYNTLVRYERTQLAKIPVGVLVSRSPGFHLRGMMTIQIDPEVQSLLRPLSEAERALLEANIVAEGRVRDPLVVWDEWDILVDGHHRYAIATAHNLPFAVYRRSFADFDAVREWVSLNQAGRRNWTKDEREAWATARLRDGWAVRRVADALGVSDDTVRRDTAAFRGEQELRRQERNEQIADMAASGMTQREIAEQVGMSQNGVYRVLDTKTANADQVSSAGNGSNGKDKARQAMAATVYSHDSLEYYTPAWVIDAARAVMGGIDTDPASCEAAQAWVKAETYYTSDDDGLSRSWRGRVWLNPPYSYTDGRSNQDLWSEALIARYATGEVSEGLLLVKAALGYKWFERLWDDWPVCFLRERLSFVMPNGSDNGQSKQGTAIFYLGANVDRFASVFAQFGRVILPEAQHRAR